jgi:hypothetical protein
VYQQQRPALTPPSVYQQQRPAPLPPSGTQQQRPALPPPSVTQQQPILSSARIQQCRSPQPGPSGLQPPVSRGQKILQLSLAQCRNHNDSDSDLEHDEQLEDDDFYDSIQSIAEDDHEVEGMELYSTETTIVIGEVGTKVNYFFCSQQWIRWIRIGILLSSCKKFKKIKKTLKPIQFCDSFDLSSLKHNVTVTVP